MYRKKHLSDKTADFILYLVFIIIALICIFPFYYLLICTISDSKAVDLGQVLFLPKNVTFRNYIEVFQVQNLFQSFLVTVARTLIGTVGGVLASAYVAYFFTKENMWGRKFWYRFTIVTMYFSAGIIPVYLNMRMLGLLNNFWVYVIPSLVNVYNMILIKTSIESMPAELEESAYLDGAGYFTRFLRVVLPLQKPILATVALFSAVSHWNDFFSTKLYITDTSLYTLQFQLYEFLSQISSAAEQLNTADALTSITPTGIRLTLTAIVIVPIILVYPFIQKYYVKGIMIGAVKG
ncbi:ABC transporter permease [Lachnoclostridium sp. An169]|uniref:carbohydrate ABC transporter permease n=1 Tax=Lachnoclostridium sp. An169 TaxID=1965569 RepID=UPI000B37BF82|nr:carbohydrate ABC transporter permease [Lachnoclostridium sp. An169]OUP85371.1 ABC transporter permease [Lachnoclostridium sp. An169]HJA67681.1 carbohydrate ABC transporter permease [Candidatus Mediterraneibacter cottocaccae]